MNSLEFITYVFFISIETITGILFNSFLVVVSLLDQNEGFIRSPITQIQFSMGLTNVALQCVLATGAFVSVIASQFSIKLQTVTNVLLFFFLFLGFWLTAWLCCYYFVTIVRFNHKVITSLKMRLSAVVPKLLLVTVLGCFFISVPSIWYVHIELQQRTTGNLTDNYIGNIPEFRYNLTLLYVSISCTLGCILPLILALTSIAFTLTSLLRHVWRIKLNTSSSSVPQLGAHYRACRTMILLVLLYVFFNMTEIISASTNMISVSAWSLFVWFFTLLYPTAQSLILILGSFKLKISLCRIVSCTKK